MELTAAGLLRNFTGFPFNHYTERLREPMRGKDTKSVARNQHDIFISNDGTRMRFFSI